MTSHRTRAHPDRSHANQFPIPSIGIFGGIENPFLLRLCLLASSAMRRSKRQIHPFGMIDEGIPIRLVKPVHPVIAKLFSCVHGIALCQASSVLSLPM